MELRIVKIGKDSYRVEKKMWLGWFVYEQGAGEWAAEFKTLKEAEDWIDELFEYGKGKIVIRSVTL